ncbi:hypothetical protein STEG23_037347, partial [Scotinomys teguina]
GPRHTETLKPVSPKPCEQMLPNGLVSPFLRAESYVPRLAVNLPGMTFNF